MRKVFTATLLIGALAVSACQMTSTERQVFGGVAGAAGGLAVANLLGANTNWTIISTVAGAAAGTLLARDQRRNVCAYARGDGTYYEAPCPR